MPEILFECADMGDRINPMRFTWRDGNGNVLATTSVEFLRNSINTSDFLNLFGNKQFRPAECLVLTEYEATVPESEFYEVEIGGIGSAGTISHEDLEASNFKFNLSA